MEWINYNQFYYFWLIAQEMSVTAAAERARVSQSNLSEQLKQFEENLGAELFLRKGKRLRLTESGRIALDYANSIFSAGQEMTDVFKNRPREKKKELIRIGAISSLSKNLQFNFIKPLLGSAAVKLVIVEGELNGLVRELQNHALDVVISNIPARSEATPEVYNHRLCEMQVSLVGVSRFKSVSKNFPKSLNGQKLFLPSAGGKFRSDFDAWAERERLNFEVCAEIEDMALLRLFAMSGEAMAIVPEVVVQGELNSGKLLRIKKLVGMYETFYAVTITRKFPNPKIERLVRDFSAKTG